MARCRSSIAIVLIGILFVLNTLACIAQLDFKCKQDRVIDNLDGTVTRTREEFDPEILLKSHDDFEGEALCAVDGDGIVDTGSCIGTCGMKDPITNPVELISDMAGCFLNKKTQKQECACCLGHFE